jgi:hypothetical protein
VLCKGVGRLQARTMWQPGQATTSWDGMLSSHESHSWLRAWQGGSRDTDACSYSPLPSDVLLLYPLGSMWFTEVSLRAESGWKAWRGGGRRMVSHSTVFLLECYCTTSYGLHSPHPCFIHVLKSWYPVWLFGIRKPLRLNEVVRVEPRIKLTHPVRGYMEDYQPHETSQMCSLQARQSSPPELTQQNLILDFSVSRTVRHECLLFKPPKSLVFCYGSLGWFRHIKKKHATYILLYAFVYLTSSSLMDF